MDVNTIFVLVMGLACPIGMGLMMWLMHKHTSQPQAPLSPENYQKSIGTAKCLAALHEQRRVLDAEITAQSQGIEMEEQSRQVVSEPSSVPEDMPISVAH